MRASQCVVLAVGMLFQGMRARLDSQGVAPWVHPQVARITLHSDVELVDVQTGHTRTIYRRSVWFTRDVSVAPDGRYVAFVEVDPGIEGGVNVRLSQPVALVITDSAGKVVRRIAEPVQRYA